MTNEELAAEIQAGRAGYGKLWEQVERFVRQQAAGYMGQYPGLCAGAGVELDDLLQAGFIALRDAVKGFDPAAGMAFIGYLAFHLKRYFRETCGIRTSKRDPLLQAARLDQPVGEEDGAATLGELTPDPGAEAERERVEDGVFRQQLHEAMEKALNTLEDEQEQVIRRRYYAGNTLAGIAADTGTTPEGVRQMEGKALRALRRPSCVRMLRPFIEEMRSGYAWMGTGWASFRDTGASSVERAAEKTEALLQRIQEQRERDKADLCALLHLTPEAFDRQFRGE